MAIQENNPMYLMLNDSMSSGQITFTAASIAKYYPENTSFWTYAMIGIGSAFIVFVGFTIYLLCKPEKDPRRPQYYSVNTTATNLG